MTDYIERDAAMSHPFANGVYDHDHADKEFIAGHESYKEWLEDLPAADVRPVVRGEWKPRDLTFGRSYYYCSSCEMTVDMPTAMFVPLYRFCPYCMSDNKKEDEG